MDRAAVFVDAGYLFAAGSQLIAGEVLPRCDLNLNADAIVKLLRSLVSDVTGLPLLRVYWYDGVSIGPTRQQSELARMPNVKLRLGFVNQQGQQKGVDSLVVTDLIRLAQNHAMSDAILMTGDGDICVGMQLAQEYGVRVHLLGIEPSFGNQSGLLIQEADTVRVLSNTDVRFFLSRAAHALLPIGAPAVPVATPDDDEPGITQATIEEVAQRIAAELPAEEMEAVLNAPVGGTIPAEVHRKLLVSASQAIGGKRLTVDEKRLLRSAFIDACRVDKR